jgi:hypothetical protein
MTHDELLAKILEFDNSCNTSGSDKDVPKSYNWDCYELHSMAKALRAVVELHQPLDNLIAEFCSHCTEMSGKDIYTLYPCLTIKAIEKELK